MKSRQITFVDGKATREAIEKITGTKKGLVKICKSKDLPQPTLSRICINGYGDPKIIDRYIEAGIPIVTSNSPRPSRTKVEYTRAYRRDGSGNKPEQKAIEQAVNTAKQLRIEDLTGAEQIKELLISHLTALIEDLKKI